MRKYRYSSVNSTSYILTNIGIYLSPIVILPILVLLKIPGLYSIILSLLIFGFVFFIFRKSVRITSIYSIIENEGFGYLNQQCIPWELVKWYRIDTNNVDTIESVVVGLKDLRVVKFTLYKKVKEENDWETFKTDFKKMIDINCPVLTSYFESKSWDILIMIFVFIEIIIFIAWPILDLDNSFAIPISSSLLFGILLFSAMVYSDRSRIKKRNKLISKNLSDQISVFKLQK